jgi:hypothetical protein
MHFPQRLPLPRHVAAHPTIAELPNPSLGSLSFHRLCTYSTLIAWPATKIDDYHLTMPNQKICQQKQADDWETVKSWNIEMTTSLEASHA